MKDKIEATRTERYTEPPLKTLSDYVMALLSELLHITKLEKRVVLTKEVCDILLARLLTVVPPTKDVEKPNEAQEIQKEYEKLEWPKLRSLNNIRYEVNEKLSLADALKIAETEAAREYSDSLDIFKHQIMELSIKYEIIPWETE